MWDLEGYAMKYGDEPGSPCDVEPCTCDSCGEEVRPTRAWVTEDSASDPRCPMCQEPVDCQHLTVIE